MKHEVRFTIGNRGISKSNRGSILKRIAAVFASCLFIASCTEDDLIQETSEMIRKGEELSSSRKCVVEFLIGSAIDKHGFIPAAAAFEVAARSVIGSEANRTDACLVAKSNISSLQSLAPNCSESQNKMSKDELAALNNRLHHLSKKYSYKGSALELALGECAFKK